MNLTGKAKKDFHKWINNNWYHEESMYSSVINSLIIEWLDSVGIYVSTISDFNFEDDGVIIFFSRIRDFESFIHTTKDYTVRQQATEKAIEKANEIYNKRGN